MPKASHVYRKKRTQKHTTPMGSNNNKLHFLYKHMTDSGSTFLNLMRLTSPTSPEGEDKKKWED